MVMYIPVFICIHVYIHANTHAVWSISLLCLVCIQPKSIISTEVHITIPAVQYTCTMPIDSTMHGAVLVSLYNTLVYVSPHLVVV